MIVGIGVDLATWEYFEEDEASPAFLERTFSPAELADCDRGLGTAACLAGKFAAKEAFSKALGSGMRDGLWFTQIEVLHDDVGAPTLRLSGEAERQVKQRGVSLVHVTITHSGGLAVAVVILESNE
jgi:holo-[acyl-carrier protein] synthase